MSTRVVSPIVRYLLSSISLFTLEIGNAYALILGLTVFFNLDTPTLNDFPFTFNFWQLAVFFSVLVINMFCHAYIFHPPVTRSNTKARSLFFIIAVISFATISGSTLLMDPVKDHVKQLIMLNISSIITLIKVGILFVKKPYIVSKGATSIHTS